MTGTFYASNALLNVTGNGTQDTIGSQFISKLLTSVETGHSKSIGTLMSCQGSAKSGWWSEGTESSAMACGASGEGYSARVAFFDELIAAEQCGHSAILRREKPT